MPRKSTVSKKLKAQIDEQVRKIASTADELLHYSAPRNADVQIFEHLGGVHYKYADPAEIRALVEEPDESDIDSAIDALRLPRAEDDEEDDADEGEDPDEGSTESASGLVLQLQADPNPDFAPGSHEASIAVPLLLVPVESLGSAQSQALRFIAEHDLGAGNWTGGLVLRDGQPYARISYNGRIWDALTGQELTQDGSAVIGVPAASEPELQHAVVPSTFYVEMLLRLQRAAWDAGHYSGSDHAAEHEQAAANYRILLRRRLLDRLILPAGINQIAASFPQYMEEVPVDSLDDFPEVPAGHWIWRAASTIPAQEWAGILQYLEQPPTLRASESQHIARRGPEFERGWRLAFFIARQAPAPPSRWPSRQEVLGLVPEPGYAFSPSADRFPNLHFRHPIWGSYRYDYADEYIEGMLWYRYTTPEERAVDVSGFLDVLNRADQIPEGVVREAQGWLLTHRLAVLAEEGAS